ncbi:MAG: hypothetical protein ACT4OQ_09725 [Chloroflexota bacterium]
MSLPAERHAAVEAGTTVDVHVALREEPDSVGQIATAITRAGGRLHRLSTVRTLPEVHVVELELSVGQLEEASVMRALTSVRGVFRVACTSAAAGAERRSFIGRVLSLPARRREP